MTGHFTPSQVARIAEDLAIEGEVDLEQLRRGMEVELEHGLRDPSTNVTDDDPVMTARSRSPTCESCRTTTTAWPSWKAMSTS